MINYNSLPRLKDSISYIYIEHAIIERKDSSITAIAENGHIQIPISQVTCLMLGPGTSITQQAIKIICERGCLIVWCGERCNKYYASGFGETRSAKNLLKQVRFYSDKDKRTIVAKRMYELRFPKLPGGMNYTIEQLRGMEGIRVKEAYKLASRLNGIPWLGRKYKINDWDSMNPINKALTEAHQILYSVCQAAIVSLGYSTGIGFVHKGKLLSFVYDIADLYKADTTIPAAFEAVKMGGADISKNVRLKCRQYFERCEILKRIAIDIEYLFQDDVEPEDEKEILIEDEDVFDGEIKEDGES